MRSLVMSDLETGTEWSHLLGRGMSGQLEGKVLKPLVSDILTWAVWRKRFPSTTVLDLPRTAQRFTKELYADPDQYVFGFDVDGKSYMIPMARLIERPVQSLVLNEQSMVVTFDREGAVVRLFDSKLAGKSLSFQHERSWRMRDEQTNSSWDLRVGEAVSGELKGRRLQQRVGIMSFRKAWIRFHADVSEPEF